MRQIQQQSSHRPQFAKIKTATSFENLSIVLNPSRRFSCYSLKKGRAKIQNSHPDYRTSNELKERKVLVDGINRKIASTIFVTMKIINMTSMRMCLCAIVLSSSLVDGRETPKKWKYQNSTIFEECRHSKNSRSLDGDSLKNFHLILNFITKSTDFQPLYLAIGCHEHDNDILDEVSKYLTKRLLDHRRFVFRNFSKLRTNSQFGTTWIIVVDDHLNLDDRIRENSNFWKSTDKFFVIIAANEKSEISKLRSKIFQILWNQHRIHKILLSSTTEKFRYIRRYMPLEKKTNDEFGIVEKIDVKDLSLKNSKIPINDENRETTYVDVDESSSKNFARAKKRRSIFENFHNFNGHPMNVTIFPSLMMNITTDDENVTRYDLLDARIMTLVEKRLGAKFRIDVITSRMTGDPFINGLNTIDVNGYSEIVFTGYFEKMYSGKFSFASSVFEDKVCLIAPSSEPIPKFFMPILPFSNGLWFILGFYNFVVAILWLVLQRLQSSFNDGNATKTTTKIPFEMKIQVLTRRIPKFDENLHGETFSRNLRRSQRFTSFDEPPKIHSWIIRSFDLLTIASYPLYGGKTCSERAFLFGTLFFGLIVIGLYESYLVSSLSKPLFYPELDTLSDVARSNRTIITKYANLRDDTFNQGTPISDKLQKKIVISTSKKKTYDMVVERGLLSIGRFTSFQLEDLTEYYNKETNKLSLHMVEECAAAYPLSYPVRFGSPYLDRINDLLLRIQQNGFIDKWYDDMLRRVKLSTAKRLPRRSDDRAKLTVEHLSLVFFGLGIGIFCSTIVFVLELRYARKFSCRNVVTRARGRVTGSTKLAQGRV